MARGLWVGSSMGLAVGLGVGPTSGSLGRGQRVARGSCGVQWGIMEGPGGAVGGPWWGQRVPVGGHRSSWDAVGGSIGGSMRVPGAWWGSAGSEG